MLEIIKEIYNKPRTLISPATRETLRYIKSKVGGMKILYFKSGSKVFDWVIPKEWIVKDAYIKDKKGKKIIDYKKNLLSIVYYSIPVNKWISKKELKKNIYFDAKLKNATPYVTSYYKKRWGFCMSKNNYEKLISDKYKIFINSKFIRSKLEVGEKIINGKKNKEIFFSTYICHPSMANDNLSGIALQTYLINYVQKNYKNNKFSYRFVFLPETIGSIAYLSRRYKKLRRKMFMGFNLSCVGDERAYSVISSRNVNSTSNLALRSALIKKKNVKFYSFLHRGSDERQYCSPGIDLPVTGFSKSKFHEFKEYHTSKDNLDLVTQKGLNQSFDIFKSIIDACEKDNFYPKNVYLCEPQLSKKGLVSSLGLKYFKKNKDLKNFLAYADGKNNLFEISTLINLNLSEVIKINNILLEKKIVK